MDENILFVHVFPHNIEEIVILDMAHKHEEVHIENTPFCDDSPDIILNFIFLFGIELIMFRIIKIFYLAHCIKELISDDFLLSLKVDEPDTVVHPNRDDHLII